MTPEQRLLQKFSDFNIAANRLRTATFEQQLLGHVEKAAKESPGGMDRLFAITPTVAQAAEMVSDLADFICIVAADWSSFESRMAAFEAKYAPKPAPEAAKPKATKRGSKTKARQR